jgi:hypothetical protein
MELSTNGGYKPEIEISKPETEDRKQETENNKLTEGQPSYSVSTSSSAVTSFTVTRSEFGRQQTAQSSVKVWCTPAVGSNSTMFSSPQYSHENFNVSGRCGVRFIQLLSTSKSMYALSV